MTPWFPTKNDPRGGFILDSITALETKGINAQIVVTTAWKPGASTLQETSEKIHKLYYWSIPRHYLRYISNWSYKLRLSRVIANLVKKHNIHLINAHTELCGIVATHVGKMCQIPTVITLHGIDTCPRMWAGAAGKMIDNTLGDASRVVVVGEPLLRYFKQRLLDINHFRVVHNGFRLYPDMLDTIEKRWGNSINFISVSNLQEGKGVDITLHALAALKEFGMHNWRYTVIGEGKERQSLETLVEHLGLTSHVLFTGYCSHKKVCELLKKAEIFCLPSYREAFGIAYLEAMAYGLLAIGIEGEGPQAFIKHHETGLLVKPLDINDLLKNLKMIFQQKDSMRNIAHKGRMYVLDRFTWAKHAESLLNVYEEIL